ncbi:fibulin-1-like isoform X2 [Argiope bruennichi]|uniref:fibulin-1-like isoform X2 n=1 Tax=Argiope bruennichi TaxID=94029 RepID=UPI002493D9F3|nr:fibulin-1-like isoform X2 [Argiope bruennichi]
MELKVFFTVLAVLTLALLKTTRGDLEPVLQSCCSSGEVLARNQTTCAGSGDVAKFPPQDRLTCLTAIYICCIRTHRQIHCENGKNAARTRKQCSIHPQQGGEAFKDCCDACTLGLQAESMQMPCTFSSFSFGLPWDEAFQDCCQNPYSPLGTSPEHANFSPGNGNCGADNPCDQKCEEIGQGVRRCSCYPGYKLTVDLRTCEDIDECLLEAHNCDPATETCLNSIGGFQCLEKTLPIADVLKVACPVGYEFNQDRRTCDDVDECQAAVCPRGFLCMNTKGSYRCLAAANATADPILHPCPRGFQFHTAAGRCIDLDECAEGIDTCDRTIQMCQNSHGSYQCLEKPTRNRNCPAGFKWNGNKDNCEDVDECTEGLDDCADPQLQCRNTIGGYGCIPKCPPELLFDPQRGACVNIQEIADCASGLVKCEANQVCVPVGSTSKCVQKSVGDLCEPGLKPDIAPDGVTGICVDVNECEEYPDACDIEREKCENAWGSYECLPLQTIGLAENFCPPGFKRDPRNRQCIDVDECAERIDNCDRISQRCVNTNGSYECENEQRPRPAADRDSVAQCPPGYRPRQGGCEDVDECLEGRHRCLPDKEQCVNVPGAYKCQQLLVTPPPAPSRACPTGRRFDPTSGSCQDVDECEEGTHTCDPNTQECLNAVGSFRCISKVTCPYGYRWVAWRRKCEDINECMDGDNDCDRRTQMCINTPGSYQCQTRPGQVTSNCGTGYVYDASRDTCTDLNECDILRPCRNDQVCENTPGSYRCVCSQGFTLDTVTKECKDVNECQLQLHSCAESQRCDNTIGSYTCVRTTSCGTGYTLNAATSQCEDDDECLLGTHNCGPGFECRNTLGSFRCHRVKCPSGQKLLSDGTCKVITCGTGMEHDDDGNCIDINECARNPPCRLNQRCINTAGSYRCQNLLNCGSGYELNEVGDQCVDVDECERRIAECGPGQTCRNRQGGYICECPRGYSLSPQRVCEDIDECSRFRGQVCASNSECINTQGSYTCNCNDGFRAGGTDKSCVDIDECAEQPNICQQTCNNVWGSYQCSCKLGYTLAPDERSCQDINECEVYGGIGSLCIGFCVNEPGSFKCSCPNGYRLSSDGRTCQDIDECQEQNICNDDRAVCLNTRGGYKCNRIECPPNYVRDKDHRNRCKRSSRDCVQGSAECLKEPLTYSYNYITFVSNMRLPLSGQLDLFTMRGPRFQSTTVQFSLELKDARAPQGTPPVTKDYFHLRRTNYNEAMVSLIKTIKGPQEIELDLIMKIYHNGLFGGTAMAKLYIFVTEHEF